MINMAVVAMRELAAEFGENRCRLRPTLGKAVLHRSLSAAPGEKLTDEQWREVGQRYLRGMGFGDNQFAASPGIPMCRTLESARLAIGDQFN